MNVEGLLKLTIEGGFNTPLNKQHVNLNFLCNINGTGMTDIVYSLKSRSYL
jgi:hypothetical protein